MGRKNPAGQRESCFLLFLNNDVESRGISEVGPGLTFDACDSDETCDDWVLVDLYQLVPVHSQFQPVDGREEMKVEHDGDECEQTGLHNQTRVRDQPHVKEQFDR